MTQITPPTGFEQPAALPPSADTLLPADGASGASLVDAIITPTPGLVIDTASIVVVSAPGSIAYYNGGLTGLGIGAGLLITSGTTPGFSNTVGWFGQDNGMAGDADLDAVINPVFQTMSYDATSISFNFEVTDPSITGISFSIVFGTDEYPEWVDQFVDIAAIVVNGVNVAFFGNVPNAPLSVISQNLAAGYFIDNADSHLPIEYDGVSHVLTVFAPVHLGTNSIKIAIADTGDHIYDSGLFISGFHGTNLPTSGVSQDVPCTEGNDDVSGGGSSEVINGLGGDDHLNGGGGDDVIAGGSGTDDLQGGAGKDFLDGGGGHDLVNGGQGDDTLQFSGDDVLDGGDGVDTVIIDLSASAAGVSLDFSNPASVQTLPDGSTMTNVETVSFIGGSAADQVTGGGNADTLNGGLGDDRLAGGAGDDAVEGGGGNDIAVFSGGSFNYKISYSAGAYLVEDLRAGAPDGADRVTGVETFRFSNGDFDPATLVSHGETILGTAGDDVLGGSAFDDTFSTGAGDDIVDSLGGNDQIDLGADNDIVHAGAGDDVITGGLGDDEVWGDDGVDTIVFSGNFADYAIIEQGDGYRITDLRAGSPDGRDQAVGVEYAAFADGTVKLTIGSPPVIETSVVSGQFTEPGSPTGVANLGGQILFSDKDHDDTHTLSVVGSAGDQSGLTFNATMNHDTSGSHDGQVDWSLDIDTAVINALGEGQVRTVTYTVRVTDSAGNSTDQDVTVDITGTNDAPIVSGDILAEVSDATGVVTVDALTNTSDVDLGAKLHVAGAPASLPAGVAFDAVSQTFSVDPADPALLAATGGTDATINVDYMVTDGLVSVAARIVFHVTGTGVPINSAPVVAGDVDGGTVGEDAAPLVLDLLGQASDANAGDVLAVKNGAAGVTATLTSGVWTAGLAFGVSGASASIDPAQFNTLAAGDVLAWTLDYVVADGAGGETAARTVFTIAGANDAPDALALSASHVTEASAAGTQVGVLTGHDVDHGDSLAFSINSDPSGLFAVSGDKLVVAAGATLSAATVGAHTVRVAVTDAAGASYLKDFVVTVDGLVGATIVGTKGNDVINGVTAPAGQPHATESADTIRGGAGNDTISSLGGADTVRGETGNDTLLGGTGSDVLDGGLGIDTLDGGAGDDVILIRGTEAQKDLFTGGSGEESLGDAVRVEGTAAVSLNGFDATAQGIERWIGNGQNVLGSSLSERFDLSGLTQISGLSYVDAGSGNDLLIGSTFVDDLRGGSGNDDIDGGAGADILQGGSGNDTYHVDDAGDQIIELTGAGTDTVLSSIDFSLAGANLENLTIVGGVGRTGVGNALANLMTGGAGADTLDGGDGKDVLDGGAGDDTLIGGLDDDTFLVDSAGDVIVEAANGGKDTVKATASSYTLSGNLETLIYVGAGAFTGIGNDLANTITGDAGDDTLNGGAGDDKLYGGLGADNLIGGDGKDSLDGGAGADTLAGGAGNDSYIIDDSLDAIIEVAGGGSDSARVTAQAWTLSDQVESLTFIGSGDFAGTGNALANSMTGGGGADSLVGLGGADKLIGGAGGDSLTGGSGADTLTGGLGADVFVFTTASDSLVSAQDRIVDFSQLDGDRIDLSQIDANSGLGGDQAFDFLGTAAFTHHAGELRYAVVGGVTTVSLDINGDGVADMAFKLTGAISLTVSDFFL